MKSYLVELAQLSASLAVTEDLGDSWKRLKGGLGSSRDILALKIGKKPENGILIIGGQHANEWLGIESSRLAAKWLTTLYTTDDHLKYLMDNSQISIVPMANPDGNEWDHRQRDDQGEVVDDKLWRKNRHINADGTIGVDLNRNYPHSMWGEDVDNKQDGADDNHDTSHIPSDAIYCRQ